MKSVNTLSRHQIKSTISAQHTTLESCKSIINLETFNGFSEDYLVWSVTFFKNKYLPYHVGYPGICYARDECKKKNKGFEELAKTFITKAILDLEIELNRELYIDLISFLIFRELEEGK